MGKFGALLLVVLLAACAPAAEVPPVTPTAVVGKLVFVDFFANP